MPLPILRLLKPKVPTVDVLNVTVGAHGRTYAGQISADGTFESSMPHGPSRVWAAQTADRLFSDRSLAEIEDFDSGEWVAVRGFELPRPGSASSLNGGAQ